MPVEYSQPSDETGSIPTALSSKPKRIKLFFPQTVEFLKLELTVNSEYSPKGLGLALTFSATVPGQAILSSAPVYTWAQGQELSYSGGLRVSNSVVFRMKDV